MTFRPACLVPFAFVVTASLSVGAFGQPNYQLVTTITLPGGLGGYDINWVDPGTERYFLADRGAGGRIDVVDTRTMKLLYTVPSGKNEIGFAGTKPNPTPGCSISGPNGVVAIPQMNQLYVGDGDSTVKVVDLVARAVVATIPTGGSCRADELAFDPVDRIVMIANDQESPPFLTFISTDTQAVLGKYTYPVNQIGNGLEQPVWNPKNDRFYQAVPASSGNSGRIDVINPLTMQVERSFPTVCSPAGLVVTPNQRLMTSCGQVFDAISGNSLGWQNNALADQLWYNPGDNYFYFGYFNGNFGPFSGQGVAVVDNSTNQLLTYIPASTHSLAVDPNYNRIFIPVSGSGIQVWAAK
jgi:YVTN family beta-propeller protein